MAEKNYIINTTFIVDPPVHGLWYDIVTNKFIPFIRKYGFDNLIFTRVLTNDNNSHYTYSIQIPDSSIVNYEDYMANVMTEYETICGPIFGDKAVYYISLLKKIEI